MNKLPYQPPEMDYSIFRAYDIRGVYPGELNPDICYAIGQAYCQVFNPKNVAIGMDVRLSSAPLKEGLVQGILDAGHDVIDLGKITTDMVYFAVGYYGFAGGIAISASHNPPKYNGLKMIREKATAISSDTGLFTIRDVLKNGQLKAASGKNGKIQKKEIIPDYVDFMLSLIGKPPQKRFKFVANTNFGYTSLSVKPLADRLKLEMIPLNFEPDGSFPKGAPNPLLPENQRETEQLVLKSGADFAAMWDGDGDRVMFVDDKGAFIPGVYITALLAKIMLEQFGKDNEIIFDPRAVWPILKAVREAGGRAVLSKAGHAFIKDRLRSDNALFAGELSGHYYFRDFYYCDNGILPWLLIMKYLSEHHLTLAELVAPFREGHCLVGELNYDVPNVKAAMDKVISAFSGKGREDFTDGYSVETDNWRFNIRPSNTEPILRLNVEAHEESTAEDIRQRLEKIIAGHEV
jgi:phosphomannomutase